MQSKNSGEVDVLNTLIESKEKQITSLKEKVPCFEYSLQYALVPHILSFLIYMQAVQKLSKMKFINDGWHSIKLLIRRTSL